MFNQENKTLRCINCLFYVAITRSEGKCHFNSPDHVGWPTVQASDFCSKWQPDGETQKEMQQQQQAMVQQAMAAAGAAPESTQKGSVVVVTVPDPDMMEVDEDGMVDLDSMWGEEEE